MSLAAASAELAVADDAESVRHARHFVRIQLARWSPSATPVPTVPVASRRSPTGRAVAVSRCSRP